MEDLTAAGRAADKTIRASLPPAAVPATSVAEALRSAQEPRGWTPLPELEGKPALRLGEWNEV